MAGRPEIASHGVEGDALLVEVASALETLRRLLAHPSLAKTPEAAALGKGALAVEERLDRPDLAVVVAGGRASGKTTFMDALFGDRRLGQARGRTRITTFLRRADAWDFCAKLGPKRSERFSELVPRQDGQLREALAAARAAVDRAHAAREQARASADAEDQAAERAEAEGRSAFAALEGARETAMVVSQQLMQAENDERAAQTALATVERGVPVAVRERAPWWALWAWLVRLVFVWFRRSDFLRYRATRAEHDESAARLAELRERATSAAVSADAIESRLAASGEDANSARTSAKRARSALATATIELERAAHDLKLAQQQLDSYDDAHTQRFFAELFARSDGPNASALEIEIEGPAPRLPDGVVLIDAPALTEGSTEERARAWVTLADRADGCILLAELDRAVSESTKRFLQQVREVVPHVLLVLTKMDKAFVNAVGRGGGDPWEQVEHARRIGTRRFAREVGRSPDSVLSIAVAAQAALDDPSSGLARRFEAELTKLFQLLRQERALILGTRAAAAVSRCIAGTSEAEQRADQSHAERIAALEANRLPEPEDFQRGELEAATGEIEAGAERALAAAATAIDERFSLLRAQCTQNFASARTREEIRAAAARSERDLADGLTRANAEGGGELEQALDQVVREIEVGMFSRLRERYGLIHEVRRSSSSLPRLEQAIVPASPTTQMVAAVDDTVTQLSRLRWMIGGGGAIAAALLGSLIALGPGTLIGAVLGGLCGIYPTRSVVSRRAQHVVLAALDRQRARATAELRARAPEAVGAIHDALDRSLGRAIVRFGRMIAEPLEAEQQIIDRERRLRAELGELRQELEAHDNRLGKLAKAAAEASVGLCR